MQLTIPNTFINGTEETNVIDAPQMNANFSAIAALINGNIEKDNIKPGSAIVLKDTAAVITGVLTFSVNPVLNAGAIPDAALSANIMLRSVYDTNLDGRVNSADHATAADNADTLDTLHAADLALVGHGHDATYAPIAKGVTNGDTHDHIGGDGAGIAEGALSLSDVVTADFSPTKHGLCPKAPADTTKFLRGDATWAAPASSLGYALSLTALGFDPADGSTYYFGIQAHVPETFSGRRVYIPKAGNIKVAYIHWQGIAGSAEDISMYIRLNNTTDTLIATVGSSSASRVFSNNALNIAVVAGDYIEVKIVCPTWVTNPTSVDLGGVVYIE